MYGLCIIVGYGNGHILLGAIKSMGLVFNTLYMLRNMLLFFHSVDIFLGETISKALKIYGRHRWGAVVPRQSRSRRGGGRR